MEKIKVSNVTKIFGPRPALALRLLEQGVNKEEIFNQTGQAVGITNVSFEVQEGEIVVIMGLSGSGKSTLLRCLNRLIDPTQGQVFIDGVDIMTLDHDALLSLRRQKFGMVFQHFALFPHRNILNNVEYGLEIQGIEIAQRQDKARQALKLVGLEGWEDAMPSQLSGGMQQRVGLARALAVEPDILLMDEAFSALDPLIRGDMQSELLLLQERVRKTIVFITHDLDEALKIGTRVVLMKDGQIVQIGTPEDIINAPATDYVKRFVEHVDKTKVMTANSVLVQPRAIAYLNDSPQVTLQKMQDENLSSLVVVTSADQTLQGVVRLETVNEAVARGDKSLENIIERKVPEVTPKVSFTALINILAKWPLVLPVVDKQGRLQGIVVKGAVLMALAQRGNN
jgi:glycine betaine/proline transport system ATP-binding protein